MAQRISLFSFSGLGMFGCLMLTLVSEFTSGCPLQLTPKKQSVNKKVKPFRWVNPLPQGHWPSGFGPGRVPGA
ncbi:MAG: hypothetical protein VX438_15215, partial [Planctomycetota bacterium]|nr:hypothetical protein [Planctomycetota bacterium]